MKAQTTKVSPNALALGARRIARNAMRGASVPEMTKRALSAAVEATGHSKITYSEYMQLLDRLRGGKLGGTHVQIMSRVINKTKEHYQALKNGKREPRDFAPRPSVVAPPQRGHSRANGNWLVRLNNFSNRLHRGINQIKRNVRG